MRNRLAIAMSTLLVGIHAQTHASGRAQALPVQDGRPVVAAVNGDAISLDEFASQLGPAADRARLRQGRGTADEVALLERLVTIKLIAQEAARIGLDEVPEIRKQVEVSSREILREVLLERLVKDVKPDPAAVEKAFQELVREWKTTSLLFHEEAAARRAREEIAGGAAFDKVATGAVTAGQARTDHDAAYHARTDYLPQIAAAIAPLRVGQVSPVVRLQAGFVILKVVDIRHPANADARAEARKRVTAQQQLKVLEAHETRARRRYVVVKNAVLSGLDYEAPQPGLDALLTDARIVAEIKGAAPVTVADLTDYLRMQFFHGADRTKQGREMNAKKDVALDATLTRRLLNMEALKLGIGTSHAYRDRVSGYRESLIFDSFVQKVIAPDNKMTEDEVKRHYSGHLQAYSYPEMLKVRSLAFTSQRAADAALRKLGEGTDFGWMAANADSRVPPGTEGLLALDGRPLTIDSLPDAVRAALGKVRAGEFRLYASREGPVYVLAVQQVIAATPKPYAEVREDIARMLYGDKLEKAVADYGGKLRAHSQVETYLVRAR